MDFWQTVQVVFRRWYITFPAFLAALGVAGLVYGSVPTQYVSTSVLLLTTPTTGPTKEIGAKAKGPHAITNPLLYFGQGLNVSASILIQTLGAPETAASLGISPEGSTSYEVTNGSTNAELLMSGPFVVIEGTSSTPQQAQDIVQRVSALAAQDLAQRQKKLGAPAATYISVNQVVPPTTPEALNTTKLRAAGAAGVLGVFAGLAAGFAFESVATSKSHRRSDPTAPLRPELDADRNNSLLVTSLRS